MFKSKTPAQEAIKQLESLARDYAAPRAIINAARREVESEIGKHDELVCRTLDSESSKPGTLADARRAIIALRLKTRDLAAPVMEELAAAEVEISRLHAENSERIAKRIREGTEQFIGAMLAAQVGRIAPAAVAEQQFQAGHAASSWARTTAATFDRTGDFDDFNFADHLVRQHRGVTQTLAEVRAHSAELENPVA